MKIALRVRVEVLNHLKLWTLGACGLRIAKCKIGCFVVSSKLGKFPVTGSGTEECLLSSAVLFFFFFLDLLTVSLLLLLICVTVCVDYL